MMIGLEVKASKKSKRRPEQINLSELGCYQFVWSVDMAIFWITSALYRADVPTPKTIDNNLDAFMSSIPQSRLEEMGRDFGL
jgi:hypothetical protein